MVEFVANFTITQMKNFIQHLVWPKIWEYFHLAYENKVCTFPEINGLFN